MNNNDWQPHESPARTEYVVSLERKLAQVTKIVGCDSDDLETEITGLVNQRAALESYIEKLLTTERELLRMQRLLDHATQNNPGTSTLVMLMNEVEQAKTECAEVVRAALANSDACWRMEQEVLQRKLDEARRDLGEILAIIHRDGGHYTGEHGISKSVADAHATWAAMVRERDEARHRARRACQILIAEVGAHGPADVDSVAERSAAEIQNLRDEIEGLRAEVEMLRERLEVERTPNGAGKWNAERVLREKAEHERDELKARLDHADADAEKAESALTDATARGDALSKWFAEVSLIVGEHVDDDSTLHAVRRVVRERDKAQADFDSLEDDAAKVVLAYRNGDKIELDEAVESLASNGRPQWWENVKPIGLRGESDD